MAEQGRAICRKIENHLKVLDNNIFEYCLYHLLKNDEIVADF